MKYKPAILSLPAKQQETIVANITKLVSGGHAVIVMDNVEVLKKALSLGITPDRFERLIPEGQGVIFHHDDLYLYMFPYWWSAGAQDPIDDGYAAFQVAKAVFRNMPELKVADLIMQALYFFGFDAPQAIKTLHVKPTDIGPIN